MQGSQLRNETRYTSILCWKFGTKQQHFIKIDTKVQFLTKFINTLMILFLAWKTVLTFLLILRISKGNELIRRTKMWAFLIVGFAVD